MWKVKFNGVEVFTSKTDIEALQFALSFHQASNVAHFIEVIKPEGATPEQAVCLLNRE